MPDTIILSTDETVCKFTNDECEYGHTLTPNEDGDIQCYIFVLRDLSTGKWNVWTRSYDLKTFGKSEQLEDLL